jgi:predicted  nucleic acid-binding Zn-ribbon protein
VIEALRKVRDLMAIDDELAGLEAELEKLPERRAQIEEARATAGQRIAEARGALEQAEHEQRRIEREIEDRQSQKLHFEGQTSQVKSNEAYRTLLHEIEQARVAISERETRVLELMEEVEAAAARRAAAEREADALGERLAAEERELEARTERLGGRRAERRAAREQLRETIDPPVLARYDRIAAHRRPAAAIASKEVCLGCGVGIPPQIYMEVARGERLYTCESCHRILIHERWLE